MAHLSIFNYRNKTHTVQPHSATSVIWSAGFSIKLAVQRKACPETLDARNWIRKTKTSPGRNYSLEKSQSPVQNCWERPSTQALLNPELGQLCGLLKSALGSLWCTDKAQTLPTRKSSKHKYPAVVWKMDRDTSHRDISTPCLPDPSLYTVTV